MKKKQNSNLSAREIDCLASVKTFKKKLIRSELSIKLGAQHEKWKIFPVAAFFLRSLYPGCIAETGLFREHYPVTLGELINLLWHIDRSNLFLENSSEVILIDS